MATPLCVDPGGPRVRGDGSMERVPGAGTAGREGRRRRRRRLRTSPFVGLVAGIALLLPLAPATADEGTEPPTAPVPESSVSVGEPAASPPSGVSRPSNADTSTPSAPASVPEPALVPEPEVPPDAETLSTDPATPPESGPNPGLPVTDPGATSPSEPEEPGEPAEAEPPAPTDTPVTETSVTDPPLTDPAATDGAATDGATASAPDGPGGAEVDDVAPPETSAPLAGESPAPSPDSAATGTVPTAPSPPATGVVARPAAGTGGSDTVLTPGAQAAALSAAGVVAGRGAAASGWSNPVLGRITSSFGMRVHPVLGIAAMHAGQDIANACGTPVHAAAAGTVLYVGGGYQGRTGNQVVIDHGGGIITRYGHLLSGSIRVGSGDAVASGEHIANVGGDASIDPMGAGNSTGCHLHFEVNTLGGSLPVDPAHFLALRGVALGVDDPAAVVPSAAEEVEETAAAFVPAKTEHDAIDQGAVVELAVVLGDRLPTVGLRQVG